MSSGRSRRIVKEIADLQRDSHSHISVVPYDSSDDLTHLRGSFGGPPGTPYEGGTYNVDVKIPSEYPFRPPVMKFETKVWHPNISSQTGAICLDTLSSAWSPVLTIKSALLSLQSLLSTPEPLDPQDAEVATMLLQSPDEFRRKAQEWAVKYAGACEQGGVQISDNKATTSAPAQADSWEAETAASQSRLYGGYNKNMVDKFVLMGFDVNRVVSAFSSVGINSLGGLEYELEEASAGDIIARLLGEP